RHTRWPRDWSSDVCSSDLSLARFPLAQLPTPIEELKSLSRELGGPELLIKRDDQTGLALGGNKTRKLEFLVAQALEQGANTLVKIGRASCRERVEIAGVGV